MLNNKCCRIIIYVYIYEFMFLFFKWLRRLCSSPFEVVEFLIGTNLPRPLFITKILEVHITIFAKLFKKFQQKNKIVEYNIWTLDT